LLLLPFPGDCCKNVFQNCFSNETLFFVCQINVFSSK
jgi:hypothetical protein